MTWQILSSSPRLYSSMNINVNRTFFFFSLEKENKISVSCSGQGSQLAQYPHDAPYNRALVCSSVSPSERCRTIRLVTAVPRAGRHEQTGAIDHEGPQRGRYNPWICQEGTFHAHSTLTLPAGLTDASITRVCFLYYEVALEYVVSGRSCAVLAVAGTWTKIFYALMSHGRNFPFLVNPFVINDCIGFFL